MSYKNRYTVRSIHPPHNQDLETWSVIKFDRDHEAEGTYIVSKIYSPSSPSGSLLLCDCFASNKETCRHRQMIKIFKDHNAINSGRTYDFDKKLWFEALGFEV